MPVITAPSEPTHQLPGASFTSLATPSSGARTTAVWQVEIAFGVAPTPHQLTAEEVFVVLDGAAEVQLGGEVSIAGPGDAIVVPADTTFAIAATDGGPMRAICVFPVGGQARLADGTMLTPPWSQ